MPDPAPEGKPGIFPERKELAEVRGEAGAGAVRPRGP